MGFLFSREGEPRSIKKAAKLVEDAEAQIVRNDIERAKINLKKASEQLAGCPITESNSKEMSDTMSRMADDMMKCDMKTEAMTAAERAVQIMPSNIDAASVWIRMLTMDGRSSEAMDTIEKLLVGNPESKKLWVLKGVISERDGQTPDALECYKRALSIDPLDLKLYELVISKDPERTLWMRKKAELLLRLGKTADASRELDRILSIEPSAVDILHLKAEIFLKANDTPKVQQVYDIILSVAPSDKLALIGKARQMAKDGNVAESIRFYKGAIQSDPLDVITWNEVAGLLFVANRYEESSMAYDRSLAIDPQNKDATDGKAKAVQAIGTGPAQVAPQEKVIEVKAPEPKPKVETDETAKMPEQPLEPKQIETQGAIQDAQALISSGRYLDAVKALEKALKTAPAKVDILTEIKECYKRMGRDRKVIEISDRILAIDANNDMALLDKGIALDRLGRNQNSADFYRRVLRIHPQDLVVLKDASMVLVSLEKYDEALETSIYGSQIYPDEVVFWRVQGDSYFALKKYEEAVEAFYKAKTLNSRDKAIAYSFGLALEAAKRYEEAAIAYEDALELDPHDKDIWISKGITLEWLDRYGDALTCYDYALNLDKKARFAMVRRGYTLSKMGRPEDAVKAFDRALEIAHKDIDVLEAKKRALIELARLEEVVKVCDKITRLDPKNVDAYVDQGVAYFRLEQYRKSISSFNQALLVDPKDVKVLDLKKMALIAMNDIEKVLAICDDILAVDPYNKAAMIDKANALEASGQPEKAVDVIAKALSIDPEDKALHVRSGVLLTSIGRLEDAIKAFDEAWNIDSSDMTILDNRGRTLLHMQRYDEALENFDRCVRANPANPQFHTDKGRALASLNRLQEAVQAFDQAISINQDYAEAWKFKGNSHFKLGEMPKAITAYNRAIDLGCEDGPVLRSKGKALEGLGRFEEAREAYVRGTIVAPNDPITWERLALIEEQQQFIDNAFTAIDRASVLDPSNKRLWMERAAISEKLAKDEEVLKSYDNALGLDVNDAIAWNGKGFALLRMGSDEKAMRAFEKALELDPAMSSATEGMAQVQKSLHDRQVREHAANVLAMEQRQGRVLTKEDMFRTCNVPYEFLDEVSTYLGQKESMDVASLSSEELEWYEDASRTVLLLAYRNPSVTSYGLKLSDVMAAMPHLDVADAKKVLGYIETVNSMDLSRTMPDEEVQQLLRTALELTDERKNVVGLMETFGIGIYKARRLKVAMNAFKTVAAPEPIVRDRKHLAAPTKVKKKAAGLPLKSARTSPRMTPRAAVAPPPLAEPEIEETPAEGESSDAVFLPPSDEERPAPAPPQRQRASSGTGEPLLFGNVEKELYSTFYGSDKQAKSGTIKSRKCLFHGETAAASCPECGSLLCQSCIKSGLCPRCQTPIRVKQMTSGPSKPKGKPMPEPEVDELELEKVDIEERKEEETQEQPAEPQEEESKERDWTRL